MKQCIAERIVFPDVIGSSDQQWFRRYLPYRKFSADNAWNPTLKGMIQEALAKVKGIIKEAIRIIAPMTYRQRYRQSTGRDPLRCPHCHHDMEVWRIWHPTYGVIHDELETIRRGKYASQAPRAAPTGGAGRTLWPPAGGVSLSLPGLWGRAAGQ